MKTINEKMAELMGYTSSPRGTCWWSANESILKAAYRPDSDLNQSMEVAIKLNLHIDIFAEGGVVAVENSGLARSWVHHNNTPADIARAICTGINEIMGGGYE